MIEGTPRTLRIGLVAASIGLGIGMTLGFIAGYAGGTFDSLVRTAADVVITIPGLLILVVLAITFQKPIDANLQALIIGGLTWMWPLRAIRAQVLSMRERQYVSLAKLSGANPAEIVFGEILPNLLPYLAANFVAAVSIAILITIGMDVLGLGPQNEITLGNILYWAIFFTAPVRGIWWWWIPPIAVLMLLFIGLYLFSAGLDQIANPKLRKTA
jgi:peptide/nickel transport system permease protein